jgi:hypothetical protein
MSQDLINRYQPGGDIYNSLVVQIGTSGANAVAQAALSGDETQINAVLTQQTFGNPLPTSTLEIFGSELATDPLGAPLDDLNSLLKNVVGSALAGVLTNPWVLVLGASITIVLIYRGGGVKTIIEKVKGKLK